MRVCPGNYYIHHDEDEDQFGTVRFGSVRSLGLDLELDLDMGIWA